MRRARSKTGVAGAIGGRQSARLESLIRAAGDARPAAARGLLFASHAGKARAPAGGTGPEHELGGGDRG